MTVKLLTVCSGRGGGSGEKGAGTVWGSRRGRRRGKVGGGGEAGVGTMWGSRRGRRRGEVRGGGERWEGERKGNGDVTVGKWRGVQSTCM